MFKIVAVSNRNLCHGDLIKRIKEITDCGVDVILREKDMISTDYITLLEKVSSERIIPHTFVDVAADMGFERIHLPLYLLRDNPNIAKKFKVGTSIHSVAEAVEAQRLGASFAVAGHIFNTDCKKGLPGRGIEFLKSVKNSVRIPVYAIGGISVDNIALVQKAGVDGACIMSGLMKCENVQEEINAIRKRLN